MLRRPFYSPSLLTATAVLTLGLAELARTAENAVVVPVPTMEAAPASGVQTAVLAGGCFWGVHGVFQHTAGVVDAISGYAGGSKATADYRSVSTGATGHAESVEIKFDPKRISYGRLLQIFFSVVHDPTQWNRQGPDVGTQYRSAIFTTTDEQTKVANAYIVQLNGAHVFRKPILTKVGRLDAFYPAEAYHQDYLTLHPTQPYISQNDLPKIAHLRKLFADDYIEKPTLVNAGKVSN